MADNFGLPPQPNTLIAVLYIEVAIDKCQSANTKRFVIAGGVLESDRFQFELLLFCQHPVCDAANGIECQTIVTQFVVGVGQTNEVVCAHRRVIPDSQLLDGRLGGRPFLSPLRQIDFTIAASSAMQDAVPRARSTIGSRQFLNIEIAPQPCRCAVTGLNYQCE